jgi:hypothetical protein
MNHPPRMPRTVEDDRGPMLRYRALIEMAENGPTTLDLDRHRYKATAKGICIGYFSSLRLAIDEVDAVTPFRRNTRWEAPETVPDCESYVVDVVKGTVYVRMATTERPNVIEEESETAA